MSGQLFIISAPSGCGKTSLIRALRQRRADIALCVSHTTRAPREGEIDGLHYHFTHNSTFEALLAQDGFLEHAQVFGHYYGTSHDAVAALSAQGQDVVLELDWQGALQVKQRRQDALWIFIIPPSLAELESRLRGRASDTDAVIARRLEGARRELAAARDADFLVVNDDFDLALQQLEAIFLCQRQRRARVIDAHPTLADDYALRPA